jgi:hypothetical protein
MGEDDSINYHKSTYPSFAADDVNRNYGEFTTDDNGEQNVQMIDVSQATDNSFDINRPKSLANYIQQASQSHEIFNDGTVLQQLLTVGNGLEKNLMNAEKESELNKHKYGKPLTDENGYINIEHQNEWTTRPNSHIYSALLSDMSTNPDLQNGFLMPDNTEEYYYPYGNTKSTFHNLEGTRNSPLDKSTHSMSTLPKNCLNKDDNLQYPTKHQNYQYDNAQTVGSDLYGKSHENIYWKPKQENCQDEYTTYTSHSPAYLLLKHNTAPELSTTGGANEYFVKKANGINEDIRHDEVYSDMPLHISSDDLRQLLQGKFLSQNDNSPYVKKSLSNKQKYLPGKSSEVLQEDALSAQSIYDTQAKESSTYYNQIPDMSNQKLKFSTSQDGTRLTTNNLVPLLPTASHNKIPSNSPTHIPYVQRDYDEMLNNMDRPKLNNAITSTHHSLPALSHYLIDGNKIAFHESPYLNTVNEMNEDQQFIQNKEGISPYNPKASTLEKVLTRVGSMTDYPRYKYEDRVANTSPYTDEQPTYFSIINDRNTVLKNTPFRTPTYDTVNADECATPQYHQDISIPFNNINDRNVALQSQSSTSRIQPQLLHYRPKNYKLIEGKNNMKESVFERAYPSVMSTLIPQITDSFKYRSSALPSTNEERSEILCAPEEINRVANTISSPVNDDSLFTRQSDCPEVVSPSNSPAYLGRFAARTKNEYLRIFKDNENDLNYIPTSVVTSSEDAYLTPAPTDSIKTEFRSESEDTFRESINSPTNQYPSNTEESLGEIYSAATVLPTETTDTMTTLPSETYPQVTRLNEYEKETNTGQDVISAPLNEKTMYDITKMITSEKNSNDVYSSTTKLPYKSNQISLEERLDFLESVKPAINITTAEKEIKEKRNEQSEQSTRVMPNIYKISRIQDVADPITEANHSVIRLSTDEFKIQSGSDPVKATYQPITTDEVMEKQDISYSVTTVKELLTETPHNHVSDVEDMYATVERQNDHKAIPSITLSSSYKVTNLKGLVVPEKAALSENGGNYYLPLATISLPDNIKNTADMNAETPEILPSLQEKISQHLYETTAMPYQKELKETTEKRRLNIIQRAAPTTAINYEKSALTHSMIKEPVTPSRAAAHKGDQMIFHNGINYESDKPPTVHESSHNYGEQTNIQKGVHNRLKTKATEKYISPETFTPETSKKAHDTYLTSPHIPNKTDKYESKESEITKFQTVAASREIMNEMEETNLPTSSDFSQRMYFAIPHETQDVNSITEDLDKVINDTSFIQKGGSQYLQANEYGTLQNVPFTTALQKSYNKDKMTHTTNANAGFENAVADKRNQNNVQDAAVTQLSNNSDDTDMRQDNAVFNEQSVKMNGHTDNLNLQQFILEELEPFLNLDNLQSQDILHANIRDMIKKTLEDVVNSTDILSKPHGTKRLIQDHSKLWSSDYLQPLVHTRNSLPHMLSKEDINTNPTIIDYANGSGRQMDITTEQALVMYHEKNRRLHAKTPETTHLAGPHIPNKTDKYENTESATTFQTATTSRETMNKMRATNLPIRRSHFSRSMHFATPHETQDVNKITENPDKVLNNTSLVQKDGSQYLHRDEYGTLKNALYATRLQENYNKNKTTHTTNANSGFENTVADKRNQNIVQDVAVTQLRNNFDDTDMLQKRLTTSDYGADSEALHFINPTLSAVKPQENRVMNSYIQLNGTEFGDNTKLLHKLQNKQDTVIFNEPTSVKMNDRNPLQPLVYTRNSLAQMLPEDDTNTYPTRNDYANGSRPQTDISTEQTLVTYHEKNQRPYTETPESAGLSINNINNYKGKADDEQDIAEQRQTSKDYTPQIEAYDDLPAIRQDHFHSRNTQLPKEMQKSGYTKQKKLENTIQLENLYPNLQQDNLKEAYEDGNIKQDMKFEIKDNEDFTHNHKAVPEYSTISSGFILQTQTEPRNKESHYGSLGQTAEPEHTSKDYNEVSHAVTQYTTSLSIQNTKYSNQSQQSGVVMEKTITIQEGSKRTGNIQHSDTTNAVKQSDEDAENKMSTLEKSLMFLLQNKDKIKLLLDLPYPHTMTSAPSTLTERENQFHMIGQPIGQAQGQTEGVNPRLNGIIPTGVDYNSIKATEMKHEPLKNIMYDSIKSEGTTYIPPSSLGVRKGQKKFPQENDTVKSERYKTTDISDNEHNLRYAEAQQQPPIPRKKHSFANFMVPSLKVSRSEVAYEMNLKPENEFELTADAGGSDGIRVSGINLVSLPQKSNMRTERSTKGPCTQYKNFLCMPAFGPKLNKCKTLNHYLLHSDDEHKNTVPISSYKMSMRSDPVYDYESDTSSESVEMAQDSFLNLYNQQHNMYNNIKSTQHSDTVSEKEMTTEKNIIENYEENQSLSDGSTIHTYNTFDSPPLFRRFYMYNDERSLQPKLSTKRKSKSYHDKGYVPEESYQQVIQNNKVVSRPVSLGNRKYKRSSDEIIQSKLSAFENYIMPNKQHLSNESNSEENITASLFGLKKSEKNEQQHDDDNGQIMHSESDKRLYKEPPEWKFLKIPNRQFLPLSEVHGQFKELSEHKDSSKETTTQASSKINLRNANEMFDDNTVHMSISGLTDNNKDFDQHNINYKKTQSPEEMQNISQNVYKYSNDYKYPINYQNSQQNNEIHKNSLQHLLRLNNNIFHHPDNNNKMRQAYSLSNEYETNENNDNNVVRRTRNTVQYTTTGSTDNRDEVYPKYQSSSCQSYNCQGVLTSEIKVITSVLKWLKDLVTGSKKI